MERLPLLCRIVLVLPMAIASAGPLGAQSLELVDVAFLESSHAANVESACDGLPSSCDCAACGQAATAATPSMGGPWCLRTKLTGDWHCMRTALATSGITIDADNTSFYFGNTRGGLNRLFDYGGHADYVFNVDAEKLGLMQGQFWKIRAEHQFGGSISDDTGAIMPATILPDLPFPDREDVFLTNVILTQFFSEQFAVFAGKVDTLDGDTVDFASGRGKTQFSNLAMVANPIALRTIPYSTLGAGFIVLRDLEPVLSFTVLNATDTAGTSGFDELFDEGAALVSSLRLPTRFYGLPGHQLFGGTWSSRNFVSLGQDPRVILPNVPVERSSESWSLFWNCDQYLVVDSEEPLRGWGYFARAGIADDSTNPMEWFLSGGLGGASPLVTRPADTWGVGWYKIGTSDELGAIIETVFGPIGNGQGVELFYNAAVTPWFHVTPDLQVLVPAREQVDTALVAGVRANIDF